VIASIVKRVTRLAASSLLILAGLALSVPGIPGPGVLVMLVGIFLLLPESRWLRKKYVHFKRVHPRVFGPVERLRTRRRARLTRRS
jgi:UPF0716 family protein affecting phage T7 exclusion